MNFTHRELVEKGYKWLMNKNCGFAFKELSTINGEIPDVIGFKSFGTILIECKTSRQDFKADSKKSFRRCEWQGVGKYRFYLCPKDMVKSEELPDKWGLLYINEKGKIRQKIGPKGNIWDHQKDFLFTERNIENEMQLMYSALRRLHIHNQMDKIYKTPWS